MGSQTADESAEGSSHPPSACRPGEAELQSPPACPGVRGTRCCFAGVCGSTQDIRHGIGGHAGTVHGNKQLHEILFGTAKRIPGIRDAERMATLPNVDSFTVGGQRYSAEQVRSLQILITGWSTLRELTATGTSGGLAAWICRHAPSMSHLEKLELDYSDVTDADLKELRSCSQLRKLDLSSTQITTKQ